MKALVTGGCGFIGSALVGLGAVAIALAFPPLPGKEAEPAGAVA